VDELTRRLVGRPRRNVGGSAGAFRLSILPWRRGSPEEDEMARSGPSEHRDQLEPEERANLDALTDRLTDKRERFQYFIVTAATAVVVFTLNDANSATGVLRESPRWMPFFAWVALAISAGLALFGVWTRHDLYSSYLEERYEGRKNLAELPSARQDRVKRLRRRIRVLQAVVASLFVAGVVLLAFAYAIGL
jgi:hypothetical protein